MLHKYPRTRHVEGSRLQAGDHDLAAVPFREIAGRYLVVEEKLDGANCGISHEGPLKDLGALTALAGPSTCRTAGWRDALREAAAGGGADPGRVAGETDRAEEMEGLYLKVESSPRC